MENNDLQYEYIKKFWEVVERTGRSVSTHLALSHINLLLQVIEKLLEEEDGNG